MCPKRSSLLQDVSSLRRRAAGPPPAKGHGVLGVLGSSFGGLGLSVYRLSFRGLGFRVDRLGVWGSGVLGFIV